MRYIIFSIPPTPAQKVEGIAPRHMAIDADSLIRIEEAIEEPCCFIGTTHERTSLAVGDSFGDIMTTLGELKEGEIRYASATRHH
jgi:hypothetical protein